MGVSDNWGGGGEKHQGGGGLNSPTSQPPDKSSTGGSVSVDAVYLDFQKAFDKVSHEKLVLKMRRMGWMMGLCGGSGIGCRI